MGTMVLPNVQDYWSTSANTKIPFFSNVFTKRRFNQLFWMLHLKTVNQQQTDIRTRIQRVSNFMEYINSKFAEYFIPGQDICVDESVIKFKGKISFITYNPNKPTKWGIRIYVLADSETRYVYNILPYYGSITSDNLIKPQLPVSTRIPLHLYNKLLSNVPDAQGYHMYTDRYYTSIVLAEELLRMKCHLTGTIKIDRKGIPDPIKKPKFGENKSIAYKKGRTMILSWKDKRVVTLLSTSDSAGFITKTRFVRGGEQQNVEKPKIVVSYTASMGGVDRADQYASSYCFLRKSLKWWRKMFFWGMEMSAINAYILYKCVKKSKNEKPLSHLKFVKRLVDQLVGEFREDRSRPSTSTHETRLDKRLHILRKGKKRDCLVCSNRQEKGQRRETSEYCDTCPGKPRMHMGNCFERYHTLRNFKP